MFHFPPSQDEYFDPYAKYVPAAIIEPIKYILHRALPVRLVSVEP